MFKHPMDNKMADVRFFWISFSVILFFNSVDGKTHKLRLASVVKCDIPQKSLDKGAPVTYYLSARKVNRETALLKTNFTVGYRYGPVFFTVRGFQVHQNGAKDLVFKLEKQSCKNPATFYLITAIKLNLDKDCYALPGNYESGDINIDDFNGILSKIVVGVGRYAYEVEFSTSKGIAVCVNLSCDVLDIKKKQ